MKKIIANQEILLLPESNMFKKDWCEKNTSTDSKKLSQKEQLIQLCWNGMLKEMMPEILETDHNEKPLPIWEINDAGKLLDLRMGEFSQLINDEWSINPYTIIELSSMN